MITKEIKNFHLTLHLSAVTLTKLLCSFTVKGTENVQYFYQLLENICSFVQSLKYSLYTQERNKINSGHACLIEKEKEKHIIY